jgi:hypothetical protein
VTRRFFALLGVLAVTVSFAAVAGAATTHPTKHKFKVSAKLHMVPSTTPGVLKYKGTVTGSAGKGTAVTTDKITSATTATSTTITKYKHGSLTAVFKTTNTPTPTGVSTKGTGHVKSGTGIYRHAKGKLKVTGTATPDLKSATLHVTGTITY